MCEEGLVGGKEGEEEMLDGREGWAERPEAELWMQHVYSKKRGRCHIFGKAKLDTRG